jgi:hypothetical protein
MRTAVVVLTLIAMLWSNAFSAPDDAGRVSAISGTVKTESGKSLRLLASIKIKERIEMSAGSMMKVIFYRDNHEEQVKGPCAVIAEDPGFSVLRGEKGCLSVTRRAPAGKLAINYSGRGRSVGAGLLRGVYLKVSADILDLPQHPTFRWKPVHEAVKYEFQLKEISDGVMGKEIAAASITEALYVLQAPLVEGRQYACLVRANGNEPPNPDVDPLAENTLSPYVFTVPTRETAAYIGEEEKKLAAMSTDDPEWLSAALALLNLYVEYGAADRAGRLARQMRSLAPDDDYIRSIIRLY